MDQVTDPVNKGVNMTKLLNTSIVIMALGATAIALNNALMISALIK